MVSTCLDDVLCALHINHLVASLHFKWCLIMSCKTILFFFLTGSTSVFDILFAERKQLAQYKRTLNSICNMSWGKF